VAQVGVGLLLAVVSTSFYLYFLVNKLERRAATDPLTGLLNRSSFEQLVEHARVDRNANDERAAVLLLDLDGFKEVNDMLGHRAGDELLRKFASKLVTACRGGDVIARFGGDEFVIFARHLTDLDEVQVIANRIHQAICSLDLEDNSLVVTASIGVCPVEGDVRAGSLSVTQMLQRADRAMYRAKANGRAQTVFSNEGEPNEAGIAKHEYVGGAAQ
jgi:diguanylate cyclase (GGDEF)-like protein